MTADELDILSAREKKLLEEHHFDRALFEQLRSRYQSGMWTAADNRIKGKVTLPEAGDIQAVESLKKERATELYQMGMEALESGEVGALILNGGMATRFGGAVKGCVDVFEGRSFLGLKLADAARYGGAVPVLLMNSFATDEKTKEHLQERGYYGFPNEKLQMFTQNISLRLTPDGELFRSDEGDTLYAPGHGDIVEALRRGALQKFREEGGRYLMMSNVDNVLASLDPLIVGMHIAAARERGVEMTVEVVDNLGSASGGMPARVDGHLQIVEAFRFPESFDVSAIPVYNTNTFMFTAAALDRDFDLTWFVVEKNVKGRQALQFERLAGQLTAYLKSQFIQVPRQGQISRFLPIKRREDLEENREFLREATGFGA